MSKTEANIAPITEASIEKRIVDFTDLLNKIKGLDDKKKELWKQIYENAIQDRQNSYYMFMKLVDIVEDKSTEHAVHGKTIATFIERMSKANDQLIRLADLVNTAEKDDGGIDPEEMFARIGKR